MQAALEEGAWQGVPGPTAWQQGAAGPADWWAGGSKGVAHLAFGWPYMTLWNFIPCVSVTNSELHHSIGKLMGTGSCEVRKESLAKGLKCQYEFGLPKVEHMEAPEMFLKCSQWI